MVLICQKIKSIKVQVMKKLSFLVAVLFVSAVSLYSQDLDSLLKAHAEAMGYASLSKVRSMHITGENIRGKGALPFTIWTRGQQIRYESEMRGMKMVQVYDGREGWMLSPRSGDIRPLPERLAQGLEDRVRLGGYLARWQDVKAHLTLAGEKEIHVRNKNKKEKVAVYVIRMKRPDGSVHQFYIRKDNGLLLKETDQAEIRGNKIKRTVRYGDYRNVDGVMVAFHRVSEVERSMPSGSQGKAAGGRGGRGGMGQGHPGGGGGRTPPQGRGGGMGTPQGQPGGGKMVMEFTKVEFNVPVDDALFTKESLK